jgi:hypothetical protein
MANYLSQGSSSHLELGAGFLYVLDSPNALPGNKKNERFVPTMTLGYRFQPWDGGFVFRLGITPLFNSSGIAWSGGLSIGAAF